MYQSFAIKNFRCFRELEFGPLERVNLIAGTNNVGKTALLEALFLLMGPNNPELSLVLNASRGIQRYLVDPEKIWGWFFFNKRIDEIVELTGIAKDSSQRSLQIRLVQPQRPQAVPSDESTLSETMRALTTSSGPRELIFRYRDADGKVDSSRAFIIPPNEIRTERAQIGPFPLGVFLSTRLQLPKDDIERFSNLERVRRQDEVLAALRILDQRLNRLALLVIGGEPIIGGDIGLEELVPLPFMGEGIGRLLSIVVSIANASGGTVFIDEIENGLHYSTMVKVWQAIAHAARQSDAQVFATTHSWECIRAAHEAFATGETYDFRLHRLERVNGEIKAMTYDQRTLATAIAAGLEVR